LKILCISDQIDPLVYSPSIKERFADIDLVLSAGDLPFDYLDYIISNLNKPLLFVFGNHHTEEIKHFRKRWDASFVEITYEGFICGAIHLESKVRKEGEIIFAGLGGCMRYNNGANQYTNFQMYLEIIKIIPRLLWNRIFHGRFLDILLTHAPPKGIHDKSDKCHQGFESFLWFMNIFKPKYLVHGHIHLYDLTDVRSTKWKNTTVVNVFSHYIIDMRDKK
jgi:Icc-related predicted phosphoesterase